jgi:hypothetical protein
MGLWVKCSDEGSSASFLCVPGHGRFVAAAAYDRIGEKGKIKRKRGGQDNGDKIKERAEKRRFASGCAPGASGEPRRG